MLMGIKWTVEWDGSLQRVIVADKVGDCGHTKEQRERKSCAGGVYHVLTVWWAFSRRWRQYVNAQNNTQDLGTMR